MTAPSTPLVVGLGARRGVAAAEVLTLLDAALAEAGLPRSAVRRLATLDRKAAEPGLLDVAHTLGVPLRGLPAAALAAVPVPHPSPAAHAAVGTPSVAEAAALADGGTLLVPKRTSARATVAIATTRQEPAP